MKSSLRRRRILAGLSSWPLARTLLRPLVAHAETGPPKRLLIIHRPCGTVVPQFFPRGGSETSFSLPAISAAFEALRSDMLILGEVSAPRDEEWPGDAHGMGLITMMTGKRAGTIPGFGTNGDSAADSHYIVAADSSIDQVLLRTSPLLGGTSHPSLQLTGSRLSAAGSGLPVHRVMSYSGRGTSGALFPEARPAQVASTLFGNLLPGTGDSQAAAKVLTRRRGVLDLVSADLKKLMAEAPRSERARLEQHALAVDQLVRQLTVPVSTQSCSKPSLAPLPQPRGDESLENAQHEAVSRQMLQLIKAAFLCDLTRVVTFTFAHGNSAQSFAGILKGQVSAETHHDISHGGAESDGEKAAIDRWYCDRVAELLIDMKNTPEGNGTSLLDNTLVVYFTEVSDGNAHDHVNMPVMLFGGKSLGLRGGRHVKLGGRSMSDVWVSIAQALGASMTSFGDPAYNRGPAPGLFT